MRPTARQLVALLVAVFVAVFAGTGAALFFDEGNPDAPEVSVSPAPPAQDTITLPAARGAPEQTIPVDDDQQQSPAQKRDAHNDVTLDLHEDARDETPPGVSGDALREGRERTAELADQQLRVPIEPAGAQAYSCPARHVVNQSGLSGRRVGVALHFTVSNPGSLDAIRGLFNRSSFGASSNYGFELFNLRCQQWVPDGRKAWAQGAANSAYISIEIITNDRSRASWLSTPAFKRGVLAALVRDLARKVGAPLRLVDPRGCAFPPGITDHDRLECGNTHWDVGRNFPWDVFMRQVRRGVRPAPVDRLTKVERAVVRKRCYHRGEHLAGRKREANLLYSRYYRARILYPQNRRVRIGRHEQLIPKLDRARARDRRPWSYRHRGARRATLAKAFTGRSC